jgi:hypothetical protein
MYKTYVFIEGEEGADPFRFRGEEARVAVVAALPGLVGYTQTRALAEQVRPPVPFVGVAEFYFDDISSALDSAGQVLAVSKFLNAGARVGPVSTGHARTVMRLAAHHNGGFIKGVFPFRRKANMAVDEFQARWWLRHGAIAARTEDAVYYLQCHPLKECYVQGRPPYDGVTELHWPDMITAKAALASRQMREDQAQDSENFVDRDSIKLIMMEEEVVVAA